MKSFDLKNVDPIVQALTDDQMKCTEIADFFKKLSRDVLNLADNVEIVFLPSLFLILLKIYKKEIKIFHFQYQKHNEFENILEQARESIFRAVNERIEKLKN